MALEHAGPLPAPGREPKKRGRRLAIVSGAVSATTAIGITAGLLISRAGSHSVDNPNPNIGPDTGAPTLVIPTPEATTPTAEPTKKVVEKYPYELGFRMKIDDHISLAVTKQMTERTHTDAAEFPYQSRIESLYFDTDRFPNAQEQFTRGVYHELYLAWVNRDPENRSAVSESDYIQKINNNDEDVKILVPVRGVKGTSLLPGGEPMSIDPRNLTIVITGEPVSGISNALGSSIGFRELNDGSTYLEVFDDWAGGIGDTKRGSSNFQASFDLSLGLTALKSLKAINDGKMFAPEVTADLREAQRVFMPIYDQSSGFNTHGLLLAKGTVLQ